MKKLITLLTLFSFILSPLSYGRLSEVDRSIIEKDRQLLSNPGFESGTATWSTTGSPSFTLETASPAIGKVHGKIDFSAASEALTGEAVTVPELLKSGRCQVQLYYKSASLVQGDVELQAYDGSNVLASLDLPAHTDWGTEFIEFPCPSSGTIAPRLASNADAALIEMDQWHVGSSLARIRKSLGEFVGAVKWAPTAACEWIETSGSFNDFPADADCDDNALVYEGKATAEASIPGQLPQIHFDSLPSGRYIVKAIGAMRSLATSATAVRGFWRFHDGTNAWNGVSATQMQNVTSGGIFVNSTQIEGEYTYTVPQGETVIKVQHDTDSDQGSIDATLSGLYISVYRVPLSSEDAVSFDQADWKIDANIGGANINLGTSAQATYVGMTNSGLDLVADSSSHPVQIACASTEEASGTTCSGDESNGIAFTIPKVGHYKACAAFGHQAQVGSGASSGAIRTTFQIVETGNTDQTIAQEGKDRISSGVISQDVNQGHANYNPVQVCGTFYFASAGKKTLRTFYEQSITPTATASNVLADRDASNGQSDIHWTVKRLGTEREGITFNNAVASSDSAGVRLVSAFITNSGTPAVSREDGNWINGSPVDNGTGTTQLNINSGIFSAAPNCTCSSDPSRICSLNRASEAATRIDIDTRDDTGAPQDEDFSVICVGPK